VNAVSRMTVSLESAEFLKLELIVVYFDPKSIRILKIHLVHAVRTSGNSFTFVADALAVRDSQLVEMRFEIGYGGHAEGEMDLDVVLRIRGRPGHYVKLAVRSGSEPNMASIMEWFGDLFESDHVVVKVRALLQVADEHSAVIELRLICDSGLRCSERCE